MREIFLVSAVRTAIGGFGGSLRGFKPAELGAIVTSSALERAGISPDAVGHVVFGQVIPTSPKDAYVARVSAVNAGIPHETPALTVNRLCGSGLQAIVTAAQTIMLGDCDIAIGGGTEVMSKAPFHAPDNRWGRKLGDSVLVDTLNGALTDPFHDIMMGVTAENVAERYGISRAAQDDLAVVSQQRAAKAIAEGRFKDQIVPVEVKSRGKATVFDTDEHVRNETTLEGLSGLKPLFVKENGTVTAGNASGINDGAAAIILASRDAVEQYDLKPVARLVSYGHAGVEPEYMGIGPVPATQNALKRSGLSVDDLDVVESNEAFAAQACAVSQELGLDPAKVNPNGSGISLGHPIGATGAIITTKLVHELQRSGGRYGLATMCIGGGQGIAAVFEKL